MHVLCCHLGCQWLLSVTALMWQLSGIFFQEEKDGAGPQGWETLKCFPCSMPGFHYQESCQGKHWHRQPTRQNCSFLELRNSHPLWGWLRHMPLPAGPSVGIPASRMSELLERLKNLRDLEKLSLKQYKSLLEALSFKRENSWTSELFLKRLLKPETARGLFRKNYHDSHAWIWTLNRNTLQKQ